jgi:hypothetical protein
VTTFEQLTAELDSCSYLFLRDLSERGDNSLRLLLEEGAPRPEAESLVIAGVEIKDLHRVQSNDQSRLFEVIWTNYVIFSVTNESYGLIDRNEELMSGRKFQILTKSRFIDYLRSATFATDEYPGPTTHCRINCESQIIDVVATLMPNIVRFRPS